MNWYDPCPCRGLLFAALIAGMISPAVSGQSRQVPAPPQASPLVIRSVTIHPCNGGEVIERGSIRIEDGIITAVGSSVQRTRGARILHAQGLHAYPGLVSTDTILGLSETDMVSVTHDYDERGEITPEVRAVIAVNPDSDLLPVVRANGILTSLILPRRGLVPGRGSIIRMDGWTTEDLSIESDAGLVIRWTTSRLEELDQLFDDAGAWLHALEAGAELEPDIRFEAMAGAISGLKPVFVKARSAAEIESAVAWAVRRDLDIIIVGGHEADRVTELLTAHDVPVIITGVLRLPRARDDAVDAPFTLPRRLFDAGVRFCISSAEEPAHERNLPYHAAKAAAYGLPREEALRSITLSAAEIIGQGDRLGSIEIGKSGTLIITNGDPLEVTTDILHAFIDGRDIDLGTRHTELAEKYREKYRQQGRLGEN